MHARMHPRSSPPSPHTHTHDTTVNRQFNMPGEPQSFHLGNTTKHIDSSHQFKYNCQWTPESFCFCFLSDEHHYNHSKVQSLILTLTRLDDQLAPDAVQSLEVGDLVDELRAGPAGHVPELGHVDLVAHPDGEDGGTVIPQSACCG